MKDSIKLLKVVYILLFVEIVWLGLFLGKPFEIIGFHNSTVPFLLTGISGIIIGIVIKLLKDENIRRNQEAPRNPKGERRFTRLANRL